MIRSLQASLCSARRPPFPVGPRQGGLAPTAIRRCHLYASTHAFCGGPYAAFDAGAREGQHQPWLLPGCYLENQRAILHWGTSILSAGGSDLSPFDWVHYTSGASSSRGRTRCRMYPIFTSEMAVYACCDAVSITSWPLPGPSVGVCLHVPLGLDAQALAREPSSRRPGKEDFFKRARVQCWGAV